MWYDTCNRSRIKLGLQEYDKLPAFDVSALLHLAYTLRSSNDQAMLNGVLVIDKPSGPTSHDVVNRIRKVAGQRRVGHVGTLDPLATGVLPLCLGPATRIAQLLQQGRKQYRATLEFGLITDSQDISGNILERRAVPEFTGPEIERVLEQFTGEIEQVPPLYSAIKRGGVRLYRLARAGRDVYRPPRRIQVYRMEIGELSGARVTFEVECSKGTYVRTLCHDIGLKLGCGAVMAALRRLVSEPFDESDAVALEAVETVEDITAVIIQLDRAIDFVPALCVGPEAASGVLHGQSVPREMLTGDVPDVGAWVRLYDDDGNFLALGKMVERDSIIKAHPKRVLMEETVE